MYPWVTHTFNPIRGRCPHECVYCYYQANKRYEKSVGPLRLGKKALTTSLGDCRTIFVGSSTDMWAKAVPDEWIDAVLHHCCRYPDNVYVFQSKNPDRFKVASAYLHELWLAGMIERCGRVSTTYPPNNKKAWLYRAPGEPNA